MSIAANNIPHFRFYILIEIGTISDRIIPSVIINSLVNPQHYFITTKSCYKAIEPFLSSQGLKYLISSKILWRDFEIEELPDDKAITY